MFYLYWIKDLSHNNPLTEGYIGISADPHERFDTHQKAQSYVGNCIRKYTTELQILEQRNSLDEILELENEYRPKQRIGWNIAPGGQCPPADKSIETRAKISASIVRLGITPYSEKTHQPGAIEKRRNKMLGKKAYHCTKTGRCQLFSPDDIIPNDWLPGRKSKPIKIRNSNSCSWKKSYTVLDPAGNSYFVDRNLKKWCEEMNIPYLARAKKKVGRVGD